MLFIFKLKKPFLFFILIFCSFSYSSTTSITEKWEDGWVFLGGMGVTAARAENDHTTQQAMLGPNISTSIGYCENQSYCIEIGSMTSVNFYEKLEGKLLDKDVNVSLIMWESSYFLSTRIKIPGIKATDLLNSGFKLLGGYGNSVAFIREIDDQEISEKEGVRVHNEGPLWVLH